MKIQDFDALDIGPDDDDVNDPASQDDYPDTWDEEDTEYPGADDDDTTEDTEDEDLTDTEDINENEDVSDRSANDVDGNGGYPDDKGTIKQDSI